MTPDRWVLHCDCNSFYASVELLEHPELKQKPVAVCGDPKARHGIILAKNEPAKAFGVRTAEPIWQAKRKCPDLVLLPPHRERYRHFSAVINGIYAEYTDLVEPFGIDESWLDITHTWHLFASSPTALADLIRRRVRETTGLTISVGASFNKVFAKLGSDYKKPDAMTVIRPEDVARIVWPLPAGDLLYVGRAAGERLARLGIRTLVLTNAAGGINRSFAPGDLMLITDPINMMGTNPLIGPNDERFGPRFPDMTEIFSHDLLDLARRVAAKQGVEHKEGVYMGFMGPCYETAAEIRAFAAMGADAVGMSTVPEAMVSSYLGMRVLAVSCITNMATGIQTVRHSHARVLEIATQAGDRMCRWLGEVLQEI